MKIIPKLNESYGKKFGHLEVISKSFQSTSERAFVNCLCDCGKYVTKRWRSIQVGSTRTCGTCDLKYNLPRNIGSIKYSKNIQSKLLRNLFSFFKSEAKRKSREFSLSLNTFSNLVLSICMSCGDKGSNYRTYPINNILYTIYFNGIDRIDSNKDYITDNVQTLCNYCNKMKRDQNLNDLERRCVALAKLCDTLLAQGWK